MVRFLLSIGFAFSVVQLWAQIELNVEHTHHFSCSEMMHYKTRTAPNRERDVDVNHHSCYWKIDPGFAYITGKIVTQFSPLENNQQTVHFDLLQSMSVDSVVYNGDKLSFIHEDDLLTISFNKVLENEENISIYYQGIPINDGLGTFKADTFKGSPVVWTLSQPYGAPGWWPCNSALGERIDSIDIFLDVPKQFVGVSHGLLQDTSFYANRAIYHWKHKHSIPTYLIAFAAGDYTFFNDQVQLQKGILPIHNYLYTQVADSLVSETFKTKELLQFYDSIFVPYPYMNEKYGHVQFTRRGGMEHTTISFMNNFNIELVAHELVHQWVGNLVTCASWQELWLNEGVTTYFTGLTYQYVTDSTWFDRWRFLVKQTSLTKPYKSIYANDTSNVIELFDGTLRYNKPSFVMHMLRNQIGDSAFFSGFRNYLSDPDLVYGFTTEEDLKRHLESTSKQNLEWFFHQWIHKPGHPVISVNWQQFGNKILINWEQEPSAKNGFVYKIPISFTAFHGGKTSTVELEVNQKQGNVILPVNGMVDSLFVDYNNQVLIEVDTIVKNISTTPISIFPNPATEMVTIQVAESLGNIDKVELSDSQGRTVYTATSISTNYIEINVRNWPSGVYLGSVKTLSGATKEVKIVVHQ